MRLPSSVISKLLNDTIKIVGNNSSYNITPVYEIFILSGLLNDA